MAILRFVDSISASASVRLDLNTSSFSTWTMAPETTFPPPPLKRSVAATMLRDGEYVGASAYGNREIRLVLNLMPNVADTAATQLQLLHRELDRQPGNILEYRPGGATSSVFFRTFRSSPDNVQFDPNRKKVEISLLAEPFALGLREDVATVVVTNNPAAGANGMFLDLTGIKGDVETPLFIEYTDGTVGPTRPGLAIGVRSGTPYPTLFNQAESYTMAVDTSVVVDAAFSGGNKTRTTFATVTTMASRIQGNFPALTEPAGAENWGVFRVFARVAQTVAGDVIKMRINSNSDATLLSQTQAQMVDLGTLDSRGAGTASPGYSGTTYRIDDAIGIFVRAQRVSGSGNLDIDYLVFVPADQSYGATAIFNGAAAASTDLVVLDGPNDMIYVATALNGANPGARVIAAPPGRIGSLPSVRPGNNRLVVVQSAPAGTAPFTDALATTFSITCRYWPRYVHVRPATT